MEMPENKPNMGFKLSSTLAWPQFQGTYFYANA